MKAKFQNNDGFTLVELMVVVAIIGILSAIAIPNFKTYQAKAKTSEAKLVLASIYTAETTLQGDYDAYGTCLEYAGVKQANNNYYAYGFASTNDTANSVVSGNGGDGCGAGNTFSFVAIKKVAGNTADESNLSGATVDDDGTTFTAKAAGFISADSTAASEWTIDQDRGLKEVVKGF